MGQCSRLWLPGMSKVFSRLWATCPAQCTSSGTAHSVMLRCVNCFIQAFQTDPKFCSLSWRPSHFFSCFAYVLVVPIVILMHQHRQTTSWHYAKQQLVILDHLQMRQYCLRCCVSAIFSLFHISAHEVGGFDAQSLVSKALNSYSKTSVVICHTFATVLCQRWLQRRL